MVGGCTVDGRAQAFLPAASTTHYLIGGVA